MHVYIMQLHMHMRIAFCNIFSKVNSCHLDPWVNKLTSRNLFKKPSWLSGGLHHNMDGPFTLNYTISGIFVRFAFSSF